MKLLADRLGGKPLFFGFQRLLPSGLAEEKRERRLSGIAIERVGSLFELDPVEQSLDVTGDGVGSHDEGGVDCMNILARHGTLGVADQRSDRHLGEPEIVGDAGEAVA